ncbi:hypothetical protein [Aporhodopirellula aestuarii]|uniref:Secreted protein n=1 Tax=Aporhodopirellula aestuarii TaxID=2950107 RepID=A0ABT0U2W1_9BACT|nr:hypothetical protein [Aporhodopirellula aestuarii]MCM2371242.1 hypothetical protein [Aporhodopirellula aestuarii]
MKCSRPWAVSLLHSALASTVFLGLLAICDVRPSCGQTVQLPAIRQFSYSGGVLVPDQGSAFLGGNRSSAMSSSSRGIPLLPNLPGSNLSSRGSAGGVSASVTIIDLDEMDRQILGYDPHDRKRGRAVTGTNTAGNERSRSDEIAEAKSLVRNARRALTNGQRTTAQYAYELAIEKLDRLVRQNRSQPASSNDGHGIDTGNRNDQPEYLLAYARAEYGKAFATVERPNFATTRPHAFSQGNGSSRKEAP